MGLADREKHLHGLNGRAFGCNVTATCQISFNFHHSLMRAKRFIRCYISSSRLRIPLSSTAFWLSRNIGGAIVAAALLSSLSPTLFNTHLAHLVDKGRN